MKNLFLSILLILITIIIFNSCKKRIIGCTDTNASNYDNMATESCENCCIYEGNVEITVITPLIQLGCQDVSSPCDVKTIIKCGLKNDCNGVYFTPIQTLIFNSNPLVFLFNNINEGIYNYELERIWEQTFCGSCNGSYYSEFKCSSSTIFTIVSRQTTNISVNF